MPEAIPKRIWIYWDQGFDAAPALVKRCVRSWQDCNPEWTVELLDAGNVGAHVSLPPLPDTISKAHRADVLRTRLLNEHGGVWADATAWCLRPLSEWLPVVGQAGFFVFCWTRSDRGMIALAPQRSLANWFIAAAPGNAMIDAWDRITLDYWQGRVATDVYHWHADAVEYAIRKDRDAALTWERMPKLGAAGPHMLWYALERGGDLEAAKKAICSGAYPLQKLSWKMAAPFEQVETLMNDALRQTD